VSLIKRKREPEVAAMFMMQARVTIICWVGVVGGRFNAKRGPFAGTKGNCVHLKMLHFIMKKPLIYYGSMFPNV
jgi:hypothetical protein